LISRKLFVNKCFNAVVPSRCGMHYLRYLKSVSF
jgi:hypothetical protein